MDRKSDAKDMMSISKDPVEEIKERLNIVDLVQQYVSLKQRGQNFMGLCPFHDEKTPSFSVNPSLGVFHCFGCGEGGDLFTFWMKIRNLSFKEALEELADRAGVELSSSYSSSSSHEVSDKDMAFQLNQKVMQYYQLLLQEKGEAAWGYLTERHFDKEEVKLFQLGFVPDRWDSLLLFLEKNRSLLEWAEKVGLLIQKDSGKYYDRFRGRIMFPVLDYRGRVCGFSGRILPQFDNGKTGKYINSPQSLVFDKSKLLYGFNLTRSYIQEEKTAVLVEGNFDVIRCYQAGLKNVVASLGTSFTSSHMRLLTRYCEKVIVAFDGDEAGRKATQRALEIILPAGLSCSVMELPPEEDLDSYLEKESDWQDLPLYDWFDYLIKKVEEQEQGITVTEKKKKLGEVLIRYIGLLPDPLEQALFISRASGWLGISEKRLRAKMNSLPTRKKYQNNKIVTKQAKQDLVIKSMPPAEVQLLRLLLENPGRLKKLPSHFKKAFISDSILRELFVSLSQLEDVKEVFSSLQKERQRVLSELLMFPEDMESTFSSLEEGEETLFLLVTRLELAYIDKKLHQIKYAVENTEDRQELRKLQKEQLFLKNRMEDLRQLKSE